MKAFFWGLIAKAYNQIFPVKKKHWAFGADFGRTYREGSKYLLEYMLENHSDYTCYFVTDNKIVQDALKEKGIPCVMNYSFKGIRILSESDCIFTCQDVSDIHLTYRKKNRHFFYLVHGQPYKVALDALPSEYYRSVGIIREKNLINIVRKKLSYYFGQGCKRSDTEFVSATSDFLVPYMKKDFANKVDIKVLGMPRNDGLLNPSKIGEEQFLPMAKGKRVITYMPTHRKYGKGKLSPIPFIDNMDVQNWMRENSVILLVKQHPNMIPLLKNTTLSSDVIFDITKEIIDPQVILLNTDVLITDYSSVWMDYLLLKRPLLFYYYDNFEHDDAGCHYNIVDDFKDHFNYDEKSLFESIRNAITTRGCIPSDDIVSKYHKYVDSNSCERYYKEIVNLLNY